MPRNTKKTAKISSSVAAIITAIIPENRFNKVNKFGMCFVMVSFGLVSVKIANNNSKKLLITVLIKI